MGIASVVESDTFREAAVLSDHTSDGRMGRTHGTMEGVAISAIAGAFPPQGLAALQAADAFDLQRGGTRSDTQESGIGLVHVDGADGLVGTAEVEVILVLPE